MTHTSGAETYLRTFVQSRSPLELVVLLYDSALRYLRQTADAMHRGDLVAKRESLGRALGVLAELQNGLNPQQGGAIAESLGDLYAYMTERLTTANIQRDVAPVEEVIQLLDGLRDAWAQIAQTPPSPAA